MNLTALGAPAAIAANQQVTVVSDAVLSDAVAVMPGETVTWNSAGSGDPDGTIAMYEGDLDGNGSYEIAVETSTASRMYASLASLTISLRVSDNHGVRAVTTRALEVIAPPPPPAPPPGMCAQVRARGQPTRSLSCPSAAV